MGSVNRKRVVNVFDVPKDVLIDFIGEGLTYNQDERLLQVDVGNSLKIHEGKVVLDDEVDDEKTILMTQCVNSTLALDGRKLVLTKSFVDFKITKNKYGLVLDIEKLSDREEKDEIFFTDISYTCNIAKSSREGSEDSPNFYR